MQKLIDELNLYPAKDVIPTELAEKILAVYQVNAQDVNVQMPTATIVKSIEIDGASTSTIYTTPATGKFYLTNVHVSNSTTGAGVGLGRSYLAIYIDGVQYNLLSVVNSINAQNTSASSSINLQNPILVDAGTIISLQNLGSGNMKSNANIVGYTIN